MLRLIRSGRLDSLVVLSISYDAQEGSGYSKAFSIGRIVEAEFKAVLETAPIGGMEAKEDFLYIPICNFRATVGSAEAESRRLANGVD